MTATLPTPLLPRSPSSDGRAFPSNPWFDARALVPYLIDAGIIHAEDWHALPRETGAVLESVTSSEAMLRHLVELNLLNDYQAARIQAGTVRGLVLGNYRVLGRIGAGGLGIVFEAEHVHMRRKVAVKVLPLNAAEEPDRIARFLREVRAIALLDHPNIVAAIDAGIFPARVENESDLYYLVMELLTGRDLEGQLENGPLPIADACGLIYQAASALDAAHRRQLVHRDIKPSNIFITHEGNAKLLDFGLVRDMASRSFTTSADLIGTLDYMAPEQARDATSIDIRADVFGLGATLFFALVGRSPFPLEGSVHEILRRRQTQPPLPAGRLRREIPDALDAVLARMMALDPNERYATPQAIMHALLPFLKQSARDSIPQFGGAGSDHACPSVVAPVRRRARVMIAESDAHARLELVQVLQNNGFDCIEADGTQTALPYFRSGSADAVLISADLPDDGGRILLKALRANPPCANLKVLMTSTMDAPDSLASFLSGGADDYLCLPLSDVQLVARVNAAVRHKDDQDQVDRLNRQLLELNVELERGVTARTSDLMQARNSLVMALARLVEYRSFETIAHLSRIQLYCVALAEAASGHPRFSAQIDDHFIQTLECVAPLHDLGNVALPDSILLKAGPLDEADRTLMQTHTIIGGDTLQHVAHRFGSGAGFLQMAIDVARHHHERFDGSGYPDRLKGDDIPLAARIVALADAYDSLRSRRAQRPGLSHAAAVKIIVEASPEKFDPALLGCFQNCAARLDRVYNDVPDRISMD